MSTPLTTTYSEKDILHYLNGGGDTMWRAAFEERLAEDPFLADAVEGLQSFQSQEEIVKKTQQINSFIETNSKSKKKTVSKEFSFPGYITIAILLTLAISVITWYLIYLSK